MIVAAIKHQHTAARPDAAQFGCWDGANGARMNIARS